MTLYQCCHHAVAAGRLVSLALADARSARSAAAWIADRAHQVTTQVAGRRMADAHLAEIIAASPPLDESLKQSGSVILEMIVGDITHQITTLMLARRVRPFVNAHDLGGGHDAA